MHVESVSQSHARSHVVQCANEDFRKIVSQRRDVAFLIESTIQHVADSKEVSNHQLPLLCIGVCIMQVKVRTHIHPIHTLNNYRLFVFIVSHTVVKGRQIVKQFTMFVVRACLFKRVNSRTSKGIQSKQY